MTTHGTSTLIRGAGSFDGQRLRSASNVLLADGTIASVGDDLAVPAGAEAGSGDRGSPGHDGQRARQEGEGTC